VVVLLEGVLRRGTGAGRDSTEFISKETPHF
jgi:hypothetical protein